MRAYLSALVLSLAVCAAPAEEAPKAEPKPKAEPFQIYPVAELLGQAETIVIAEIGETSIDGTQLKVQQVLKGPPDELLGTLNANDRQRRAEELLKREAAEREAAKKNPKAAPTVPQDPVDALPQIGVVCADRARLPAKGEVALFMLWEREKPTKELPIRYKIAHPQCVYDPKEVGAHVKVALQRRRPEDSTRYLRGWDAEMAAKLALRRGEDALRQMPAGNLESGLTLKVLRPKVSMSGDHSFNVTALFENSRSYDQAFYDGLVSGFGVRLRRKDDPADKAIVIRASNRQLTGPVDSATLNLVDEGDFSTIPSKANYSKEIRFDAKDLPELAGLNGEYVINLFYISTQTGKGLENLEAAPWTGTLMSNDAALVFKPNTAAVPAKPDKQP